MRRFLAVIALAVSALFCGACTVVKIDGGSVRRYAGTLRVDPTPNAALVSIAASSWGLSADGRSMLLGYEKSRTIVVPSASTCAIVVIVERGATLPLPQWQEFLARNPSLCVDGGMK